jgi:hypothetical protein
MMESVRSVAMVDPARHPSRLSGERQQENGKIPGK